MKKKEAISTTSLVSSIFALVIGIILFLNKDILKILGYIVSGGLFLYGVIKLLTIMNKKKKNYEVEFSEIMSVSFSFLFALIICVFPGAISFTISIVLGTLAIVVGINRLILGITVKKIDNLGAKLFAIESFFIILIGILIITQKFLSLLGLFLILYSIFEIVSYIYYKTQSKDYSEVLNKKISKDIKESKSIEAIIDEK